MRMILLTVALALPLAIAVAEEPRPKDTNVTAKRCAGNDTARYRPGSLSVQPLGAMPSAARIRTVYRNVNGCPVPVVLERGIGANRDKQMPIAGDMPDLTPLDR